MARTLCKCGNELSNSTQPEISHLIFSGDNWVKILDRIDEGEELVNFGDSLSIECWKCPECERLIIYRNGVDKPARIYRVEETDGKSW